MFPNMEPMNLGSPVGSPNSPNAAGPSSPFLPAYLMGETPVPSKTKLPSPTKPLRHVTFDIASFSSSPSESRGSGHVLMGSTPQKLSGPPTKGLFDAMDDTFSSPKPYGNLDPHFQEMTQRLMNVSTSTMQNQSIQSPGITSQVIYDTSLTPPDDTWVTVFGFPPSSISYITSQLAFYGTIIDKKIPNKGNWIHLRYKTPTEARMALKCNGRVYPGYIMIGVIPCRDEEILKLSSHSKENRAVSDANSSLFDDNRPIKISTPSTPVPHNAFGTPTGSPCLYQSTPVRINNIRPLNQAYRTAQAMNEVQEDNTTPKKSNGMVTKAMEYVFGW